MVWQIYFQKFVNHISKLLPNKILFNDIRKKINGMNGDSDIVSSDDMTSSVQYVKSVGIHMYNPVSSFKLRCIAA